MTVASLVNQEKPDAEILKYLRHQAKKIEPIEAKATCAVGQPADAILDHAKSHEAIVIASHGATGLMRWVLGSVTTKVVRASTKPVLVISARPHPQPRPAKIEKIFVPLDGSETAKLALLKAVDLAQKHRAQIILYEGVVYRSGTPESEDWQALSAKEYLAKEAETINDDIDVQVVVHESKSGPSIVEQAQIHDADLIVMGSHGRSGVSRWILGSVTEGVIQRSTCPVFIVYGRDESQD